MHVVDVRTGADGVLVSGRRLLPVRWTGEGVYLMDWPGGGDVTLYQLSLSSRDLRPLPVKLDSALPLGGGAVWRAEVAAGVPARVAQNGPAPNSIVRVDLASGQTARWYSEANSFVSLLDFATDGSPLVMAGRPGAMRLLRLTGPGQVADSHPVEILPTTVTDRSGTWMIATDGTVLLYRPGSPPEPKGKGPAHLKPAGACAD